MKHFPDINEIKILEKNSQKNGSGIVYEELLGIWKFKYVWGKESDEIKNIPSSILQVLSARLELKSKNKEDQINYEIKKFLIKMQSNEELKKQVTSSSTADDVALIGQRLGYDFSGDDLLRFNGQKVDKVTVRKVDHPGEYH